MDDVKVLPVEETQKMNFTVNEYQGSKVYKYEQDSDTVKLEPLTRQDDIQVKMDLAVPSLTGGYYKMKVEEDGSGGFMAKSRSYMAVLEFAKDDRLCWVAAGIVNLRGLRNLKINTKALDGVFPGLRCDKK